MYGMTKTIDITHPIPAMMGNTIGAVIPHYKVGIIENRVPHQQNEYYILRPTQSRSKHMQYEVQHLY